MGSLVLAISSSVYFIFVLLYSVERHYQKWLTAQMGDDAGTKKPIKHKQETVIRALLLAPVIVYLGLISNWFIAVGFTGSVFMLLFNGLFNKRRGQPWWFEGTVDPDEAWTDNILRKIGSPWSRVLQLALPVLFLVWFLITKLPF